MPILRRRANPVLSSGSAFALTSTLDSTGVYAPSRTVISLVLSDVTSIGFSTGEYPTRRTSTDCVPGTTPVSVNLPSGPVEVDDSLPSTDTRAPGTGTPPALVTLPVITARPTLRAGPAAPVSPAATVTGGNISMRMDSARSATSIGTSAVFAVPRIACNDPLKFAGTPQMRYVPSAATVAFRTCGVVRSPITVFTSVSDHATDTSAPVAGLSVSASSTRPSITPGPKRSFAAGHMDVIRVRVPGIASSTV